MGGDGVGWHRIAWVAWWGERQHRRAGHVLDHMRGGQRAHARNNGSG